MKTAKFEDYPLSGEILEALALMGFDHPTRVQAKVIPPLLAGQDVIVKSQTGSGKTAAFGIPLCHLVSWEENRPQVLILTPTRELALQVKEDLFHIGRLKRLKIVPVFGKSPFHLQAKQLKQKTHMVVATPGRLIDHMEQGTIDLSAVNYVVIDEADEMLKMGFIEQIDEILTRVPTPRVTTLLSATFPDHIQKLSARYMQRPMIIEVIDESPAAQRIHQVLMRVCANQKLQTLEDVLVSEHPDSCMIFCNTQIVVEGIYEALCEQGISCDRIHGGMEQKDRLKVMDAFRNGSFRYLVATDVAARGIDIDNIGLVVNYDVPNNRENYVHRIGRTGRIGNQGKAITFCSPEEAQDLQKVYDYIDRTIEEVLAPSQAHIDQGRVAFDAKTAKGPEKKIQKTEKLNAQIMKLHIRGGKKTKMRPVDVVGGICAIPGITANDIGIINIFDLSTYVEILNHKGEVVLEALQHIPIKGRLRVVSKVDTKNS